MADAIVMGVILIIIGWLACIGVGVAGWLLFDHTIIFFILFVIVLFWAFTRKS